MNMIDKRYMTIINNILVTDFYYIIDEWVKSNSNHTFYLYASQQKDLRFYDFCSAVIDNKKIPVIITNVGSIKKPYPTNLKMAMNLSDDVRVYESAKMGMNVVLKNKAKLFVKVNGGVIWTL